MTRSLADATTIREFLGHGYGSQLIRISRPKDPDQSGLVTVFGSTNLTDHSLDFWQTLGTIQEVKAKIDSGENIQPAPSQTPRHNSGPRNQSSHVYMKAFTTDPNTWQETTKAKILYELDGSFDQRNSRHPPAGRVRGHTWPGRPVPLQKQDIHQANRSLTQKHRPS